MAEEQDSGQDRTEEPSDKRRKDFREKGQVAQSRDLTSVGVLGAVGLTIMAWWPSVVATAAELCRGILVEGASDPEQAMAEPRLLLWTGVLAIGRMVGPILGVAMAAGLLLTVAQVGVSWSWKPLAPDGNRMNPIKGLQNKMFSAQAIAEWVKSMAKVILVAVVALRVIRIDGGHLEEMALLALPESVGIFGAALARLGFGLLLAMLVLSLADLAFSHWQINKKMRMTLQELKEEHKENDGDPHVKAKVRQVMARMSANRLVAAVGEATVVVVNPSHYAVALVYELGQGSPPRVVARGVDARARRIKDIARSAGIPRIENRPLARALYAQSREGQEIPPDLYEAVAEVLAFVYRLRQPRPPAPTASAV